jgi:hypothetical protein
MLLVHVLYTYVYSHRPTSARDILMDDPMAAEDQRADGIGKGTKDKEHRVWIRWCEYCRVLSNEHDLFLQELPEKFRTRLFRAFTAALCQCQFSRPDERPLVAGTVEEAMAKLGQIFRANMGFTPAHGDSNGGLHPSLAQQFKGMIITDPGEKPQKYLPISVVDTSTVKKLAGNSCE